MMPYTPYQIIAYFLIYSFLGWCCEVIYCTLESGRLVNRGFLNGPVCPIYGFGMLGILGLLHPVMENTWALFLGATAITTSIELFGGWLLFRLFHARWWDYSEKPFNLGGYICAEFCLIWGLGTLLVIRFLHPVVQLTASLIPDMLRLPLLILLCGTMLLDTVSSVLTAHGMNRRLRELDNLNQKLRRSSDRLSTALGTEALRLDRIADERQLQLILARAEANDRLEEMRQELENEIRPALRRRAAALEELRKNRLLKAFPDMRHADYAEALSAVRVHLRDRMGKNKKQNRPDFAERAAESDVHMDD